MKYLLASRPCNALLPTVCAIVGIATLLFVAVVEVDGQANKVALPSFDFKTISDAASWYSIHVASLRPTAQGLVIQIAGEDPLLMGPAREFSNDQPLELHLRLKSDQGGEGQVFYFRTEPPQADQSVRFEVPRGEWYEAVAPLPALTGRWRLRLDPPGNSGLCVLDRLWFEESLPLSRLPKPTALSLGTNLLTIRSGDLALSHSRQGIGAFEVRVADQLMARGLALDGTSATNEVRAELVPGSGLRIISDLVHADGTHWLIEQRFTPGDPGSIAVESRLTVDQTRTVAYLPMFTLLPGLGSFGTNKTQGLFCGLEYLENEPSSSQADIIGPDANRQAPERYKITFPLMAIAAENRYIGLIWQPEPNICAVFDSPDRIFNSAGHVMELAFPASLKSRSDSSLVSFRPGLLRANQPLVLRATIVGGRGTTVIPALKQYVALRGLPPPPAPVPAATDYFRLAAHAWLDSEIRTNGLFHHTLWPGDVPRPAADAAVWMRWLAQNVADPELEARLCSLASQTVQQLKSTEIYNDYQIGNVVYPLPALFYRVGIENATHAQLSAADILRRFEPDGTIIYKPAPGGVDYGKTNPSPEANGNTATSVQDLLERAAFAGDPDLLRAALHSLRALDKFRDTVPRGALAWCTPLHAPDLLAAAKLLRCYTLAYELTGAPELLDQARSWAWSGLPFVYLVPPTTGAVGPYATLLSLGAGGWTSSTFGLPIPWGGVVYADALYRFVKHDPAGPWRRLADGITTAAIQQCWPLNDPIRPGLVPSHFFLGPQLPAGPSINPAALQADALRYYGKPLAYDFHVFREHGLLVHAPGELADLSEASDGVAFTVNSWSSDPASVLVSGFVKEPRIRISGQDVPIKPPHRFEPDSGRLEIQVHRLMSIQIFSPALPGMGKIN
jgi:hypothetical protein